MSTYDDYGGGHYAPSPGNNVGIGIGFSELTAEVAGICVGALYRAEYRAEASKDLLDVLVANHFGYPFVPGRSYALWMNETSFQAYGVRARKVFYVELTDAWSVKAGLGVSFLEGLQGEQQSAIGALTGTSDTYAVGSAIWFRDQTNLSPADFNPFVGGGTASGQGFSTDLELVAQSRSGWSVDLAVMDVVGRLYWENVPQTVDLLNNATITYNANLDRNALVNGVDSRVDLTEDLTRKYHLALTTAPLGKWSAVLGDDFISGLHFPSVGARYASGLLSGDLNYDIRTQAVGLGISFLGVSAAVTTNDVHLGLATVLGFSLRVTRSW